MPNVGKFLCISMTYKFQTDIKMFSIIELYFKGKTLCEKNLSYETEKDKNERIYLC